jgi:hypothetical protein
MGEWRYSSTILDLGTRWMWVVSFTPRPLDPREKSPWYPLDRTLGRPQSRSGRCEEEKHLLSRPGVEPHAVQPVAHRCTNWATSTHYSIVANILRRISAQIKLNHNQILWSRIYSIDGWADRFIRKWIRWGRETYMDRALDRQTYRW